MSGVASRHRSSTRPLEAYNVAFEFLSFKKERPRPLDLIVIPFLQKTLGFPVSVVSVKMHDREHTDLVASNSKKDAVRKVSSNGVADITVENLILLGVRRNPFQRCVHFRDELLAETLALLLVPFRGTSDVGFGSTPDEKCANRGSQVLEYVGLRFRPRLNVVRILLLISEALIQETTLRFRQWPAAHFLGDLVPQFLDKLNLLVRR